MQNLDNINIAVDAMGGDEAPRVIVRGAVEAASELNINVTLVGNEALIAKELAHYPSIDRIRAYHCEDAVGMAEMPLKAFRLKKDSSIRIAFNLAKEGDVDAVVSAGNSGAILAAGVLGLGLLEGVERPAIAGILPGEKGPVILIDAGANVDCRPSHLFQFAVMAHAFAISCLNIKNPKIGILNIGEEGGKGNEQVQMARELFEDSDLNFFGNVEGRNVFTGDVNIVVCDGFVGNVALKLSEGVSHAVIKLLVKEAQASFVGRVALSICRSSINRVEKKLNYEARGGAPLLGIRGVAIVCHGRSPSKAIKSAIAMAADYVKNGFLENMAEKLKISC
jgi:glycerol-3-phosphate acyltransferase PlsX